MLEVTRYFTNTTTTITTTEQECGDKAADVGALEQQVCAQSKTSTSSSGMKMKTRFSNTETLYLTHPPEKYANSNKKLHNLMADLGFSLKTGESGRKDIKRALQERRDNQQREEDFRNMRLLEFYQREHFFVESFRNDVLWTTSRGKDKPYETVVHRHNIFPAVCTSKTRLFDSILLENYREANAKALLDDVGLEMPQRVVASSMSLMHHVQVYYLGLR